MLQITRYSIREEQLSPWIKFIWHMEAAEADWHYKLLPTACIDVILNLASDMTYETASGKIAAPPFHINGLRSRHSFIHQEKTISVFGISFYPYGLFPFVQSPLSHLQNDIADLFSFAPVLAERLSHAVAEGSAEQVVEKIKGALLAALSADHQIKTRARIISDFIAADDSSTVYSFCEENTLNIKTFERTVRLYTGFTPKALRNIIRFQTVGNQLVHEGSSSLAEAACDHGFTDQSHLTKEFVRYAGTPPQCFLEEKISVKENANYTTVHHGAEKNKSPAH